MRCAGSVSEFFGVIDFSANLSHLDFVMLPRQQRSSVTGADVHRTVTTQRLLLEQDGVWR